MANLKCKMCGGDLIIDEESTIAECEYCGSKQTVPKADDEKKITLFGRANRLLRACEFDKAAGIYESIVADFPEEAEGYWGLILCKYGIEYVDDPATAKKVPTCHRSSFDSVMDDANFEQACENADPIARRLYRDEAKAIEELRKGIIEVSGKEQPYDIFICYKESAEDGNRTIDSVIAQDIYDALTDKGYRVFFSRISLEDKLGVEYEPYIFAALNSAKIMLAVGTDYEYYNAVWVKNEWSRFLKLMEKDKTKHLIPCYKNLDAYDMPKEFQRLQAQDMGKVGAMQDLLRGIEKIIPRDKEAASSAKIEVVHTPMASASTAAPLLKRAFMFLEDEDWKSADDYCEKVLDQEPENAEAYLGKLLGEFKLRNPNEIQNYRFRFNSSEGNPLEKSQNFKKFAKFASKERLEEINRYIGAANKKAKEERIKEEEQEKIKEEKRIKRIVEIKEKREKLKSLNGIISCSDHTVGLKSDGTVLAVGRNEYGQCDVSGWTDIVAVSAGGSYTVGLKSDGTVVAVGNNEYRRCDVSGWKDIVAVSAGGDYTVGLKSDGTVVAVGKNTDFFDNFSGRCDVSDWKDIVAVSAGWTHTVGLKSDGTVVAVGDNKYGQCDVSGWTDIVAVSTCGTHTVGLKSDGTVVAVGSNYNGRCDVSDWKDIVAVSAGWTHTVGLKSDGTVVAVGDNKYGQCDVIGWKDIVAVSALRHHTVGLKSDGTVVTVGYDKLSDKGQYNVSGWRLFNSIDTIEQERKEAMCKAREERNRRRETLQNEISALKTEYNNIRGLFSGRRRWEIEEQVYKLENELNNL